MQKTAVLPDNIEVEALQDCDLCGSKDLVFWDRARSNTLSRCKNCGLVFTNPRIASCQIKGRALYSENYFRQRSRMTEKMINARKKTYREEISLLEKLASGGKILDVGCGTGSFLSSLGDKWEKYGCDISTYAVEEARKKNIRAFYGEFEKLDFLNTQFDAVYFRASLHHAYSPRLCLKKAYDLLRPGGIVAICMSNNRDGLAGRLFKAHVRSYEQAHNYIFSTATLKAYLFRSGFSVVDFDYPYWNTGYESYRDFLELMPLYIKYLFLCLSSKVNKTGSYDFSSPAFYRNYINIYGRKKG
ncbi:class I SAM-dependent methyltransferase [Candidatus Omnitrophota bacterium]